LLIASNALTFAVSRLEELVATNNRNLTDFTVFLLKERKAFNSLALGIVRTRKGKTGEITILVSRRGLESTQVKLKA
jgi:beta-galactosidase